MLHIIEGSLRGRNIIDNRGTLERQKCYTLLRDL